MTTETALPSTPAEAFALSSSRGFPEWLGRVGASLAFTTYQAGKLFLIGLKPDGRLAVFERSFPRCMGLAVTDDGRSMLLATRHQIIRFDNVVAAGTGSGSGPGLDSHDAVYAPHATWITGDLDVHDVAFGEGKRPLFVNTLFGCVASVSDGHSFRPIWQPPFLSKLAPEDRCHLNGMAMRDGKPAFATMVARADVADGWRDHRAGGGLVYDIEANEPVLTGLSMPHSPRWHDGRLWLLNSGAGEFGYLDAATGTFQAVAFCPGYARGLSFVGAYAVIGLSLARENRTFQGLPLDGALSSRGAEARCGLLVIDTRNGDTVEWVRIEGVVRELFDVAVLPGVRNPAAIGFLGDEINRVVSIDDGGGDAAPA
jgi:uncharacterized protein (TIGR03032 family)